MAGPSGWKLLSLMDQAGLMDKVDQMMIAKASALPLQPPAASSSPTCRETQLTMPGSSASTGDLSELVQVHSFDSIANHLKSD